MDSFEWNKIIGAVLASLLLVRVIGIIGNAAVHPKMLEKNAFEVAIAAPAATKPEAAKAAGPSLPELLAKASAVKGKQVAAVCQVCHSFTKGGPNKIGPNLWGIVGSKPAEVPNYDFSSAMKKKGGTWTYEALFRFLKDPQKAVPGTKMPFQGLPSAEQRADVIMFLRSLNDKPLPLPKVEKAAAAKPAAAAAASPEAEIAALLPKASPAKGKQVAAVCGVCHSFTKGGPNMIGPNLWGIVGSKPAEVPNYDFSSAMKKKGGTWTYAALFQFLKDPQKAVPGTKMPFQGLPSAEQRADVIAFLRTLSDHPEPMPKAK